MMFYRYLNFVLLLFFGFSSLAQAQSFPLNDQNRIAHQAEADLWLDTVFGYCLSQIENEAFADHPSDLQGEWSDLRSDYASTLLQPLYAPKVSALPGAIILDINAEATSCWTQFSSLVSEYAASELGEIWGALAEQDRLKTALVNQGNGPQQVEVILIGEDRVPVIFYQSVTVQGPLTNIVTIIQKTVPNFVYVD